MQIAEGFFYILGNYNSSLHDVMYEISWDIKSDAHEFGRKVHCVLNLARQSVQANALIPLIKKGNSS